MATTHLARMTPSQWREERNRKARQRLIKALPDIFPAPVLASALRRPLIPAMPRRAVDAYWRAHPLRADRLARALAAKSGAPAGWRWRIGTDADPDIPASFRSPPAPYREKEFALGSGHCCVCGQAVYRLGWHADLWGRGSNRNAEWHACCVVAWRLWNAPSDELRLLKRLQGHRCAATGKRLLRSSEVDHETPLFRVWREHRDGPWPELLGFWGLPNLQVINREVHVEKCASEARSRRQAPKAPEAYWPTLRHLMQSLDGAATAAGRGDLG